VATKKRPVIVGVGEVLWDLLPAGSQLGGAAANFIYHAHMLGAEALMVSRVGADTLGREILARFHRLGLPTDGITTDSSAPTGTVSVMVDREGKPTYTIHENVAWDFIAAPDNVLRAVSRADAIYYGLLAQRSPVTRASIQAILAAAPTTALRVLDINLRQSFWSRELIIESLGMADVLKLNDEELPVVAQALELRGDESSQLRQMAARFELKAVALTRGAEGSSLLIGDQVYHRPGSKIEVVDTIGAGDSYTAALVMGLLAGHAPEAILECAHGIADFVCTQPGAMPAIPPRLLELVSIANPTAVNGSVPSQQWSKD
jgi:fructokinase